MDGTDDQVEYKDTMDAMATMGMDNDEQSDVIQVVTGKTEKPNIKFRNVINYIGYEIHELLFA